MFVKSTCITFKTDDWQSLEFLLFFVKGCHGNLSKYDLKVTANIISWIKNEQKLCFLPKIKLTHQ